MPTNPVTAVFFALSLGLGGAACDSEVVAEPQRRTAAATTLGSDGHDIVVVAGQSNAVGQGDGDYGDDPALLAEDSRILQIGRRGADDGRVIAAKDPLHFWNIAADWTGKGFAMPFARRYAKTVLGPTRKLVIVPAAYGGSSIVAWDADSTFRAPGVGGVPMSLYEDMKQRITTALALPGENRLVGVLWHQGETDVLAFATSSSPFADATTYAGHVAALAGALRRDFSGQGCFPFLVGEMSRDWLHWPDLRVPANPTEIDPATLAQQKAAVTAALVGVVPSIGCSSFVTSEGLTGDADPKGYGQIHFDARSQAVLAQRYLAALVGRTADRDLRGAMLRAVYTGIFGQPPPDAVYDFWVDRYDPAKGVGCRAIVQAFVLASPMRAPAEAATVATDPALTGYIRMLYRGLLPSYPADNTDTIAGWRTTGLLTMDQLDGIFLDDAMLKDRCARAGMQF